MLLLLLLQSPSLLLRRKCCWSKNTQNNTASRKVVKERERERERGRKNYCAAPETLLLKTAARTSTNSSKANRRNWRVSEPFSGLFTNKWMRPASQQKPSLLSIPRPLATFQRAPSNDVIMNSNARTALFQTFSNYKFSVLWNYSSSSRAGSNDAPSE